MHDIDAAKVERLVGRGAAKADSPETVASQVERTICMVETTAQAESVIAGAHGIIKSAKPGHIVICMSTIDPLAVKRLGGELAARGIAMVDAPVSGGTERATSGELSIICGGRRADRSNACKDLFQAMGKNIFHVGGLGQGLAMKLVNNMLVQVNMVAVAEALVMGVKAGLDPQTIYDVVSVSTGTSYAFERARAADAEPRLRAGRHRRHLVQGPGARDAVRQAARRAGAARQRHPAGLPDGPRGGVQQGRRLRDREGARDASPA